LKVARALPRPLVSGGSVASYSLRDRVVLDRVSLLFVRHLFSVLLPWAGIRERALATPISDALWGRTASRNTKVARRDSHEMASGGNYVEPVWTLEAKLP
jgi:hypothetical protein